MLNFLISKIYIVFLACNTITEQPAIISNSNDLDTVQKINKNTVSKNKELSDTKPKNKVEFITIDNLDITTKDLGFFDSKQADIACQKLGDGWRLPNEAELNVIYEQNDKLGTFKTNYYLGLGYEPDAYNENGDVKMFLRISIINGEVVLLQSDQELFSVYGVRAVRDHKL